MFPEKDLDDFISDIPKLRNCRPCKTSNQFLNVFISLMLVSKNRNRGMKSNDILSSSMISFFLIDHHLVHGEVLRTIHFHISKNFRVVHIAKVITTHAITFHGIAGKRGASSLI